MKYIVIILEDDAELEFRPEVELEFDDDVPDPVARINAMLGLLDPKKLGGRSVGALDPTYEKQDGNRVLAGIHGNLAVSLEHDHGEEE